MMDAVLGQRAKENLIEKFQDCKKYSNKYDPDIIDAAIDVVKNYLPPQCPSTFRNFVEILIEKYGFDRDDFEDNFYKMSSKPLGYCLIINNIKFDDDANFEYRHGSEVDEEKFQAFFEKAGFEVEVERNMTSDQMRERLTEFSKKDFTTVDSMIVVIMSHGGQCNNLEILYGIDGGFLSRHSIYKIFSNRIESLQLKPKVFFFIACRGDHWDYGVPKCGKNNNTKDYGAIKAGKESSDGKECGEISGEKESEEDKKCSVLESGSESVDVDNITNTWSNIATDEILTELSDIFVINSTLPHNPTVRDHEKGTYFSQFLIPVLNNHYRDEDLEAMIKRVNRNMRGIVTREYRLTQAVQYESTACLKYFWFCNKEKSNVK